MNKVQGMFITMNDDGSTTTSKVKRYSTYAEMVNDPAPGQFAIVIENNTVYHRVDNQWVIGFPNIDRDDDYTAFEVFAHNYVIPVGECKELGGPVKNAIPASLEHRFKIRSTTMNDSDSDVIIDWGDGTSSSIANEDYMEKTTSEEDREVTYVVRHEYAVTGKYIIRVYGKDYFAIRSCATLSHSTQPIPETEPALTYNLICRIFDTDLPLASHVTNISNMCMCSPRLLAVHIPSYMNTSAIKNFYGTFGQCANLISATGFSKQFQNAENVGALFAGCVSMTETDFTIPPSIAGAGSISAIFHSCQSLELKVIDIFELWNVFRGDDINVMRIFYNCNNAPLDLTGCDKWLWNNPNVTYTSTTFAFRNCSDTIRAQVPKLWGGLASDDIIEKSLEERIAALEAKD